MIYFINVSFFIHPVIAAGWIWHFSFKSKRRAKLVSLHFFVTILIPHPPMLTRNLCPWAEICGYIALPLFSSGLLSPQPYDFQLSEQTVCNQIQFNSSTWHFCHSPRMTQIEMSTWNEPELSCNCIRDENPNLDIPYFEKDQSGSTLGDLWEILTPI